LDLPSADIERRNRHFLACSAQSRRSRTRRFATIEGGETVKITPKKKVIVAVAVHL